MRADVVRGLCHIYGVDPTWLLGITDKLYLKSTTNGRSFEIHEISLGIPLPLKDENE